MGDVCDHPLGDQVVGQLGQAPGRKRLIEVLRVRERDPLDLLALGQRERRRPSALVARVERVEAVAVEVVDHLADGVGIGEDDLADRRRRHALGREQHDLRAPPRHHRARRPAHDPQQPLTFLVADLAQPHTGRHGDLSPGTMTMPRDSPLRPRLLDYANPANDAGCTTSCTVAGEEVDTGMEAKCFADYMRIHTLEATGGKTYAEMPQYATDDGKGTSDKAAASKNPETGAPVSNPARQIWVTETALTTALYVSFFAGGVALLAIIVGIALLLIGIGFLVRISVGKRRAATPAGQTEGTAAVPA